MMCMKNGRRVFPKSSIIKDEISIQYPGDIHAVYYHHSNEIK
jgi:hypothetical protein